MKKSFICNKPSFRGQAQQGKYPLNSDAQLLFKLELVKMSGKVVKKAVSLNNHNLMSSYPAKYFADH